MRKSSQVPTPARSDTNTHPSPQKKQHRASKKEKIHYPQMGCHQKSQNPRKKKQRMERSKLHTCALRLISLPLFLSISHTEVKARNPNIKMLHQKKIPKQ
jgi:hypothetical protein